MIELAVLTARRTGKREKANGVSRRANGTGLSLSLYTILSAQTLEIVSCRFPVPISSLPHSRERPLRLILAYTQ
jgi:hypothetical protein